MDRSVCCGAKKVARLAWLAPWMKRRVLETGALVEGA
jgi:hypothetical protein